MSVLLCVDYDHITIKYKWVPNYASIDGTSMASYFVDYFVTSKARSLPKLYSWGIGSENVPTYRECGIRI